MCFVSHLPLLNYQCHYWWLSACSVILQTKLTVTWWEAWCYDGFNELILFIWRIINLSGMLMTDFGPHFFLSISCGFVVWVILMVSSQVTAELSSIKLTSTCAFILVFMVVMTECCQCRPQVTIATAIVFCHRFFLRQSHVKNDRRVSINCLLRYLCCYYSKMSLKNVSSPKKCLVW